MQSAETLVKIAMKKAEQQKALSGYSVKLPSYYARDLIERVSAAGSNVTTLAEIVRCADHRLIILDRVLAVSNSDLKTELAMQALDQETETSGFCIDSRLIEEVAARMLNIIFP